MGASRGSFCHGSLGAFPRPVFRSYVSIIMNHKQCGKTGVFQHKTITETVLAMGIDSKQGQTAATATSEFPSASLADWEKAAAKAALQGISASSTGPRRTASRSSRCIRRRTRKTCLMQIHCPGLRPLFAARRPPCMQAAHGRSASTPVFLRPKSPTLFIARHWLPGAGVSVAFDLATHRGYDSDHPRVTGTWARPVWRLTRWRT